MSPRVNIRLLLTMVVIMIATMMSSIQAQRRVTPVVPPTPGKEKPVKSVEIDRSRLVPKKDAAGKEILVDTVTGKEFVDSAAIKAAQEHKPMLYPLYDGVTVGVNLWDGVMRIFGQKYGIGSVWGEVSLHNRYFPTFEMGVGTCNDTPAGNNYTYKSSAAPYFKIGGKYNFLYNSNPAYMAYAGLMYGFSTFSFSVDDVSCEPGYWGDPEWFSIPKHNCTAGYLEIIFGLRVKLISRLSAGWSLCYHRILHESSCPSGEPMYIPGYGKRNGALTGSISVSWKL